MEKVLNNEFCEMSQEEMENIDGGFWGAFLAGAVVDGVVIAATGKSCGEWAAKGIKYVYNGLKPIKCY